MSIQNTEVVLGWNETQNCFMLVSDKVGSDVLLPIGHNEAINRFLTEQGLPE